jgi:GDP-L-fucose synthase
MPAELQVAPIIFPLAGRRVWVAGHSGMVGSAIVRRLAHEECDIVTATRAQLDLTDPNAVRAFVADSKPDAIFMAAAKVGGILANDNMPADFLYDNLMITANVTEAAYRSGVGKMLFLGSSCIYPKEAAQPTPESALLTGSLEPTNELYALAKIAGIKLVQAYRKQHGCDFISCIPPNLYGIGDNFDLNTSHVLPALIRKANEAKTVGAGHITVWGTGKPRREFLHADDCADACVFLMQRYSEAEQINVGSGEDISILDLARLVCEVIGFEGEIRTDPTKPDGARRRLMSLEKLGALGWEAGVSLREGIARTFDQIHADPTGESA